MIFCTFAPKNDFPQKRDFGVKNHEISRQCEICENLEICDLDPISTPDIQSLDVNWPVAPGSVPKPCVSRKPHFLVQ
jgi:hypothetical protein